MYFLVAHNMSFRVALRSAKVSGWEAYYCNYAKLERLAEKCDSGSIQDEEAFVKQLELEAQKVQAFVSDQVAELRSRFAVLNQQCVQLPRRSPTADGELTPPPPPPPLPQPAAEAPLSPLPAAADDGGASSSAWPAEFASKASRASIRTAFVHLYRSARSLESYLLLNATAFAKAAKKFRKHRTPAPLEAAAAASPLACGSERGGGDGDARPPHSINGAAARIAPSDAPGGSSSTSGSSTSGSSSSSGSGTSGDAAPSVDVRLSAVERSVAGAFGQEAGVPATLLEQIEASYGHAFNGARATPAEVRAQLLVLLTAEGAAGAGAVPRGFLLGWRVGASTLLLAWLGWDLLVDEHLRADTYCQRKVPGYSLWQDPAIHVYHFTAALLLLEWCWCGMLVVWRRSGINFRFMLELPQNGRTESDNLASAAIHSMLFGVNM